MLKDKSISSEKSQFWGDESSGLREGSSKKGFNIYNSDISKTKSMLDKFVKERTLALKA